MRLRIIDENRLRSQVLDGRTIVYEILNSFPDGERLQRALSAATGDSPKWFDVHAFRDHSGKLVGVASLWKAPDHGDSEGMPKGDYLRIGSLATAHPGIGSEVIRGLKSVAADHGAGLYLSSTEGSAQIYKKHGFREGFGATYYLTDEDVSL